jgi:hypothetical protein
MVVGCLLPEHGLGHGLGKPLCLLPLKANIRSGPKGLNWRLSLVIIFQWQSFKNIKFCLVLVAVGCVWLRLAVVVWYGDSSNLESDPWQQNKTF